MAQPIFPTSFNCSECNSSPISSPSSLVCAVRAHFQPYSVWPWLLGLSGACEPQASDWQVAETHLVAQHGLPATVSWASWIHMLESQVGTSGDLRPLGRVAGGMLSCGGRGQRPELSAPALSLGYLIQWSLTALLPAPLVCVRARVCLCACSLW